MPVTITINGQQKTLEASERPSLAQLVADLGVTADRLAIELNGLIVPRARWSETPLANGDRLEMVHFVGGGIPSLISSSSLSHLSP